MKKQKFSNPAWIGDTIWRILFALTLVGIIAIPAATLCAQSSDEATNAQTAAQGEILDLSALPVFARHGQDMQDSKAIQEDTPGHTALAGRIEGVWDVRVTIRQCDTGAFIRNVRAMNMFIHGGTLTETAPNLLRGSSLGTWGPVGAHDYTAVFRFFRFNPDGSFAGTTKVTRNIELSRDANEFTATGSFENFDANDNLISSGCATETASRLE